MGEEAPAPTPAEPAPAEPPKEGETAEGEAPAEEVEEELNPIVDLSTYFIKPDQES